jgi:hypothetical protein
MMKLSKKNRIAIKRIWRLIRNTAAIIGAVMLLGAIGTDDIYTKELVTTPPELWSDILVGVILLLPEILHLAKREG